MSGVSILTDLSIDSGITTSAVTSTQCFTVMMSAEVDVTISNGSVCMPSGVQVMVDLAALGSFYGAS